MQARVVLIQGLYLLSELRILRGDGLHEPPHVIDVLWLLSLGLELPVDVLILLADFSHPLLRNLDNNVLHLCNELALL